MVPPPPIVGLSAARRAWRSVAIASTAATAAARPRRPRIVTPRHAPRESHATSRTARIARYVTHRTISHVKKPSNTKNRLLGMSYFFHHIGMSFLTGIFLRTTRKRRSSSISSSHGEGKQALYEKAKNVERESVLSQASSTCTTSTCTSSACTSCTCTTPESRISRGGIIAAACSS